MIHDVLLSCLNLNATKQPIEEILLSNAVEKFMHPCERKVMEDLCEILNFFREVATFARAYSRKKKMQAGAPIVDKERLQDGIYLKAFANGVDKVLEDYYEEITKLERRHLQHPFPSLLLIYQKLQLYEPMAHFLRKLIRGIKMQKLHGCAILTYIYQNTSHGDRRLNKAIRSIQSTVNIVFLKQLTFWIMYAKLDDDYKEFFIRRSTECNTNKSFEKGEGVASNDTNNHTTSEISDVADIWQYEIVDDVLPHYLSSVWAEKVLFIGQTVLLFKIETDQVQKSAQVWNKEHKFILGSDDSLWDGKSQIYFEKLQTLQYDRELNVSHIEHAIDDIKSYVTNRLTEIAVNQADLGHHLKLVKDFYLLGRGELFLEFIRQCYIIEKSHSENKLRDIVKAYQSAAICVGISDHLEQFKLIILNVDSDELHEFGLLQNVEMQYKVNWPLHLLFSPGVMERYNVLFRFLLIIKKIQYELQTIWWQQTQAAKSSGKRYIQVMHLRNQLMFFIDNLQYYIQVDVLESQFCVLLNTIHMKADFDKIQRAHSFFLANILSLCFLLTDEDSTKTCFVQSTACHVNNPIYSVFNEIFHLCADFCKLIEKNHLTEATEEINKLSDHFTDLIKQLLVLLNGLKTSSNTTPLSQLLLRLDFNQWYSSEKRTT